MGCLDSRVGVSSVEKGRYFGDCPSAKGHVKHDINEHGGKDGMKEGVCTQRRPWKEAMINLVKILREQSMITCLKTCYTYATVPGFEQV